MSKIQLIDDDEKLCDLVKDYLGKENHDVVFYTNVQRGLDGLKVSKPDLLLLDVMLPDMNGFEALKIINLPSNLEKDTTHRYSANSFKLHRFVSIV